MITSSTVHVALFTILFLLVIVYLKLLLTYWKKKGVPYLEPSLPFGNFKNPLTTKIEFGEYMRTFYNEFKRLGKQFGGIYSYVAPVFIPVDPSIVKMVLLKEFSSFHDRGMYFNEKDQPASVSIATVSGQKWKELRTKLSPTFTSARMKNMFHLITACSKVFEEHVKQFAISKNPMNAGDCVKRLTMDVTGSCAFGIECNSFEDITFYRSVEQLFRGRREIFKQTFCNSFPNLARSLKILLMPQKEVNFVMESIDETIKFRSERNIIRDDFLQMLLDLKDKGILNMIEVYSHSIVFFLAGLSTSASALTFSLFELARHQAIQEKLRREIEEVIAKHDGKVTYEGVKEMKYLQMVINETLRKHPPVTILKRRCVKDFVIPNSNAIIEKGTMIYVPVLGLHFDPEYFPEPDKFTPERFSEENTNKRVPFTYLPFGEGPRVCIGERFGRLQVQIGLISLIKDYRFTINSKQKIYLTELSGSPGEDNILVDVEFIKP